VNEGNASRTALLVAAYRARASARPEPLIHDPWAAGLAGADGEEIAARVDAFMKDRELWIAVRTAHLDAELSRWISERKATQVVVLGAGFDTRAARFARDGVRFFEVDHPATQAEKLSRLQKLARYPLGAATFVSCDFEREDFLDRLVANGFDCKTPAFILWEGVTPYLHEPAIRSTLRRIASGCHAESELWFDHFTRKFVEASALPEADLKARELVEALGERFVFGTNDPLPMLFEEGFRHVRSVSFDEACLSLTGSYERDRQFRFQRMVLASCTAPRR
jgi:methyltransferase (TIGR00027 family)